MWRPRRRRFLAAAAAVGTAATLSGCGSVLTAAFRTLVPARLRVAAVGLPTPVAEALAAALAACVRGFVQSGGVRLQLEFQHLLIPALGWYVCGAGAPCGPATVSQGPPSLFGGYQSPAPQLPTPGGGVVVATRDALDIRIGEDLPPPTPAGASVLAATAPDIILAYDTWQYWLAPLARPVPWAWEGHAAERAGVAASVWAHAHFYVAGQGTQPRALPLLRNPLVLSFSDPALVADWRRSDPKASWNGLARWLRRRGATLYTQFGPSPWFPRGTELALSLLAASGLAVGGGGPQAVVATFTEEAATAALATYAAIASSGAHGVVANLEDVGAQHLWSPLWAPRASWNPSLPLHPLPRGPRRRALPCTYFSAFLLPHGGTVAEAFAASLWSPSSQIALGAANVGLPLRPEDARTAAAGAPWAPVVPLLTDPGEDLTLADLYGTWKTDANARDVDRVSDAFAAHLLALVPAPGGPA